MMGSFIPNFILIMNNEIMTPEFTSTQDNLDSTPSYNDTQKNTDENFDKVLENALNFGCQVNEYIKKDIVWSPY